jgi:hypothetical protein
MSRILIATFIVISALSPRQGAFAGDHPVQFPAAASTPSPVLQAFEFESLFPMFISGGYHFCVAYRYEQFRVRVSVINGGSYDAEPAGSPNAKGDFKRYYNTSPGLFLGFNVWKGLEVYTFLEGHTFTIEQRSTGSKQDLRSLDFGGGVSYQFFIGRMFYIQPGAHVYLRERKTIQFPDQTYRIPGVDIAPVIRIGVRLWETGGDK